MSKSDKNKSSQDVETSVEKNLGGRCWYLSEHKIDLTNRKLTKNF